MKLELGFKTGVFPHRFCSAAPYLLWIRATKRNYHFLIQNNRFGIGTIHCLLTFEIYSMYIVPEAMCLGQLELEE